MKFLAFILATVILFLAFKPGIDTLSLQTDTEQACCGGQCTPDAADDTPKDQNQDSGCDGKSCNPFQVCGSCVLVFSNLPFEYLSKPTGVTEKDFTYQSIFTSPFASDFWQPPEIV